MKILLTNSVPLNGGDEALLRATYSSLKDAFPNTDITVLCSKADLCRKYIKNIKLDSDLEFVNPERKTFPEKVNFKIRQGLLKIFKVHWYGSISSLFASREEARVKKFYQHCDVVISSPGGFLHDFYEIKKRLAGFELALKYKKPVVLFAQSVGPFWKEDSVHLVKNVFPKLSAIILREKISLGHLESVGLSNHNIHVTTDAAFLFRKLKPELYVPKKGPVKLIAMCFRNWPIKNNRITDTLKKAVSLCKFLLEDKEKQIIFLSTCQGIPEYIDDALHGGAIINELPVECKERCKVIHERFPAVELIKEYSKCDAFIGMRLHGAILSMLGGTPAMGLAYEEKTKGIFSSLGFENYQVNFDDSFDTWKQCTQTFLADIDLIRNRLPDALDREAGKAAESITILEKTLATLRTQAPKLTAIEE